MNPLACAHALTHFHEKICELNNVAIVIPVNQFYSKYVKCPVYELSGFFPNSYGSLLISRRYKHKEKLNQAYLKMSEVGIVDRLSKKYAVKKNPVKNFQDHYSDKYNVVDEGVMFEHVKFIVIGYFMFLLIPLIVLLIEILIHKYKHRMLRIIYQLANNVTVFEYCD